MFRAPATGPSRNSDFIPRRCATSIVRPGPTSWLSRTATVFTDCANARLSVISPAYLLLSFFGDQPPMVIGPIDCDAVRRHAVLQRREIDERLERRARLPLGLHGAIELALGIIAPADQRTDAAVTIEHHEGRLACAECRAASAPERR